MRKQDNLYRNILSFLLSILLLTNSLSMSFAKSDTIYINSVDDFIKFSKDASLDDYFKDKTIILNNDINISSTDSISIPSFGGTFDGQDHTISGFSMSKDGSNQGLFRYLQEDGTIKNLNVSGVVNPSGSQNVVGGIVGNNKGNITNCNFQGIVSGKNNIGGLVGINETTGTISNCTSQGKVNGEHSTGGIVGQNLGSIFKSNNLSQVNTSITEIKSNIGDINWAQINSMENVKAHTDTGGIAGLSSGFLQDCINQGPVGYKQVGYNVGGIVGRQSGYLSNCQNHNTVLGRKDVGGIVGQIEPHLILLFSQDSLQKLEQELNTLQNLMTMSFKGTRSSSLSISSELDSMVESLNDTKDIIQILSRSSLDHIDDITDMVNITNKRVKYTLEEIIPILDEVEELSNTLSVGLDHIDCGFHNLETASNIMSHSFNTAKDAMGDLRRAISSGEKALYNMQKALYILLNQLEQDKNTEDLLVNLSSPESQFNSSLSELELSFINQSQAVTSILKALEDLDIVIPDFQGVFTEILGDLKDLSNSLKSISSNISSINKAINTISNNKILDDTFFDLQASFKNLDLSIKNISYSFSKLQNTSKESAKAFHNFSNGFASLGKSSENMTEVVISIGSLIDSLLSQPKIEFPNIDSEYRQSGEGLFENIGNISSQINKINMQVKDGGDTLINNLESIGDQIFLVFDLLVNSRQDANLSDYVEDISDENIDKTSLGKVYKNQNYGPVSGSLNIGGIVGSMGVEYDFDPEDDIFKAGSPSLNFKYLTTAILKNCINHSKINGKKDYCGGIVGRMDLGIITECENYGSVISNEGSYVGGIAGASYGKIDKSFALSSLSGRNYVGGIAGCGKDIFNSYALVKFEDKNECVGSIAGMITGEFQNNYYVHDSIAAIDGISYAGKASPLSYEDLLKVESLPKAFTEFYVSFIAEGNLIDKIPFQHGDSFDFKSLPPVPKKDGYEGHWENFDHNSICFNTRVEAIYIPLKSVLSSNILRDSDDLPLLLAEGKFNKDTTLKLSALDIRGPGLPVKDSHVLEAWYITLEDLDYADMDYTLRLLLPKDKKNVSVWYYLGNTWKRLDSSIQGSYIIFTMNGHTGEFAIVENSFPWIKSISLSLFLIILFFLYRKFKFKNKEENIG